MKSRFGMVPLFAKRKNKSADDEAGNGDDEKSSENVENGQPMSTPPTSPTSVGLNFNNLDVSSLFDINDILAGVSASETDDIAAPPPKKARSPRKTKEIKTKGGGEIQSAITSDDVAVDGLKNKLEGLLPNLEEDFAQLEANLVLDDLDSFFDIGDDLNLPDSQITSLNDQELDEALRGIEDGTLILGDLGFMDETDDEPDDEMLSRAEDLEGFLNIREENLERPHMPTEPNQIVNLNQVTAFFYLSLSAS